MQYFTYTPIPVHYSIASATESGLPYESGSWDTRNVRFVQTIIQEERLFGMIRDEFLDYPHEMVCNLVVFPLSAFSSFHKPDTRYPIDNGIVMFMMPWHLD